MLNSGKPRGATLLRRGAARPVRFAALFGALFLTGSGVLLLPPVQAIDARFSQALVGVSHRLVEICGGAAQAQGAILRAPGGFGVEMKDGCNGVTVTILLCAAVLAFPAPWRMRGLGLLAGGLTIQVLNIVRFISLFYLGQYSTTWFEFAHGYLWETLLMLDTMVVFWLWVGRVSRTERVQNALD
ncbi:MAG: exosortase H [Bryobacteraceae bacterium]